MRTQAELVNSWLPASDRPSVLLVAPPSADNNSILDTLPGALAGLDVVRAEDFAVGVKLLGRGPITVLVIGSLPEGGAVELMVEALGKTNPPRMLIVTEEAAAWKSNSPTGITCLRRSQQEILAAVTAAAKEPANAPRPKLRCGDLLGAISYLPDEIWLRVCSESGEFGDICVRTGKAVYCETGRILGDEAASTIAQWTNCLYETRPFPEFLQPNLSRALSEIAMPGTAAAPKPPAPPAAPAAPVTPVQAIPMPPVSTEEPADLPLFEWDVPPPEAVEQAMAAGVDEPLGMPDFEAAQGSISQDDDPAEPVFDLSAPEVDIQVDEPLELMLDDVGDFETSLHDMEEPELPAFAGYGAESEAAVEAEERTFDTSTVSLFPAYAVISDSGRLESCQPQGDASYFGAEALRVFFDRGAAYANRHQLGETPVMQIGGGDHGIVVTLIPGSKRLLAVRIPGNRFGEVEEGELRKLAAALTSQEAAV